jgi:hypothetical protein
MNEMGIGAQILLWLVILHFIVGFGYVMYKLSPRKSDKKDADTKNEEID